ALARTRAARLTTFRLVDIRVAGIDDAHALAGLRAVWNGGDEPDFEQRMAAWLADEGDRRTTWLAAIDDAPVGMASMLEYRRMPRPGRPDSRWGYVSNMFVREDVRNRGVGSALLAAVIAAADERDYVRLVLSPSPRSVPFYERAGFVVPDERAGDHRLLVRSV
ncbi:MAG TPA: GNAT family N-acetyltransferase, partial [Solirubrobacteraceae bacterium]|nr:GNAT family N-acetyltransferase [Solirubrobacteraceae bacterium]